MLKISRKVTLASKLRSSHFLDCFYLERHREREREAERQRQNKFVFNRNQLLLLFLLFFFVFEAVEKMVVSEYGLLFSK